MLQLENAKKPGEENEEPTNDLDIPDEEQGIEMSEDFDGKLHDLEPNDNSESEEDKDVQEELDKQMGDVDGTDADKLDEQLWGSDEEATSDAEVNTTQRRKMHGSLTTKPIKMIYMC